MPNFFRSLIDRSAMQWVNSNLASTKNCKIFNRNVWGLKLHRYHFILFFYAKSSPDVRKDKTIEQLCSWKSSEAPTPLATLLSLLHRPPSYSLKQLYLWTRQQDGGEQEEEQKTFQKASWNLQVHQLRLRCMASCRCEGHKWICTKDSQGSVLLNQELLSQTRHRLTVVSPRLCSEHSLRVTNSWAFPVFMSKSSWEPVELEPFLIFTVPRPTLYSLKSSLVSKMKMEAGFA